MYQYYEQWESSQKQISDDLKTPLLLETEYQNRPVFKIELTVIETLL